MMARLWIVAWLLAVAASAGAIAWQAIHRLTGGAWHDVMELPMRRMRNLLPLATMMGLPLLIAAAHVFPWLHEPLDASRRWYLNYPFLAGRTIGCFVVWAAGWWLSRRAPALTLILWLFTAGVFATDWIASLTPAWRSSALGLVMAVNQLIVAFAAAVVVSANRTDDLVRRDLGAILIALCLGWSYLVGVDYLTAWMADLPYETVWYLPRTRGAWGVVAIAMVALHLLLPVGVLLARRTRSRAGMLRTAAVSMLLGQLCHLAWMVIP
jgi:hypothetical protein